MAKPGFEFHPAIWRWFQDTFGSPTEPQALGWPAIQSGSHTLICAPTGSGKTLAAFLAALDALFREGLAGTLPNETRVLYVSPLKALSNDIRKNLQEPLAQIGARLGQSEGRSVAVRAEVRTGDTPAAQRQAMAKTPPHILVTTPESFYLLLTSDSGRRTLKTVRTVILDEIHAVVDDRRGAHLALSMERLEALTGGPIQRIGLSATQNPIEEVARFLVGARPNARGASPPCTIINTGHRRALDLAIELPGSPLEAVMSNEVWEEVYRRLAELIAQHHTTLVFVNTRRLAERVTLHLAELLGKDKVASHHGSLSAKMRLEAEDRLKRGELQALVATASLELGIDIGSVDLVCQVGAARSISTLLQRVGRAEHRRGGLPKGRLFPLSRDELIEGAATVRAVRAGQLDLLAIPEKPLDVLAQQIVAWAACEDCGQHELFERMRVAYPYRNLSRAEFDEVVRMLAEGFSTKRGRRAALIHQDAVNGRLRARRGARLLALTSGGAIPDNADYRVVLEPAETFLGTVNEDFAIESMAGDIFQLGNASWKITRILSGVVRVEDAQGQPPSIPFWLGEAPGRTDELSRAVSDLRVEIGRRLAAERDWPNNMEAEGLATCTQDACVTWLQRETGVPPQGAEQMIQYLAAAQAALGVIPSQTQVVMERFFDESGGMQLVIHAPFGIRINRSWGLALRKRFCRSFNFELQAAATDDAIVLSLGTQHSFQLDEVFRYLNPKSVRDLLVQALLDAPMFTTRWRWNASRSLAIARYRGGRKNPAPLQRMEAENLLAAVFPDQLACLEHIVGDREIPDHPLVRQTIDDCLNEAMDIGGLTGLLDRLGRGEITGVARDLPEPSPLAHEILNAKPYAFLDNAPLEERRTRAVYTRRSGEASSGGGLGILDEAAIRQVQAEAWPSPASADELHDALLQLGVMTGPEAGRMEGIAPMFEELTLAGRAGLMHPSRPHGFRVATERVPMLRAIYPEASFEPNLRPPPAFESVLWERENAVRELVRGRMEICGPTTAPALSELLGLPQREVDAALIALEGEGFALRGRFFPGASETEWCDRRLLARIHRLTLNRLRAEIQPVNAAEFCRYLLAWQRLDAEHRAKGLEGLECALDLLDGFEAPLAAWEPDLLSGRVADYDPGWLDQLCFSGRFGWGRFSAPHNTKGRPFAPLRSSPMSLFRRQHREAWLNLAPPRPVAEVTPEGARIAALLEHSGAQFFGELVHASGLFPSQVEQALAELAALGLVTADSFDGLRALLIPSNQRPTFGRDTGRRGSGGLASIEFAGRWALLRRSAAGASGQGSERAPEDTARGGERGGPETAISAEALEQVARALLRRYGVVFRRLLERETFKVSWFELGRIYRQWEARGEIRGGYFVSGVSGEQFARPEAVGLLRSLRKTPLRGELVAVSAADPMNLLGILTPGPRVAALRASRILFQDGNPVAVLESGAIRLLDPAGGGSSPAIEAALRVGTLRASLRPYYR